MKGTGTHRISFLAVLALTTAVTAGLGTGCSDSGSQAAATTSTVAATSTTASSAVSTDPFAGKTLVMATDVQVDDPASTEGTSTVEGDITKFSGVVIVTEVRATDERLSGRLVGEINGRQHKDGTGWLVGPAELSNAGGSWEGTGHGLTDGGNLYVRFVLEGTGEYEGLEAHLLSNLAIPAEDPPGVDKVFTGWIQKAE